MKLYKVISLQSVEEPVTEGEKGYEYIGTMFLISSKPLKQQDALQLLSIEDDAEIYKQAAELVNELWDDPETCTDFQKQASAYLQDFAPSK